MYSKVFKGEIGCLVALPATDCQVPGACAIAAVYPRPVLPMSFKLFITLAFSHFLG